MKVTILGTANAWGPNPLLKAPPPIPMAGTLSDGTPVEIRKYRTSLLVEAPNTKILVDCGPDFSHQLREFKFGHLNAIFITHPHPDHIGGLDELNLYKTANEDPIPTYATPKCWNCIKNDRSLGYIVDPLRLVTQHDLRDNERISIGSIKVTHFSVEHSSIAPGAVGFVFEEEGTEPIKRFLYTGDFWAVSKPDDSLFENQFDLVIMECDRFYGLAGPSVGGGHMSFEEALRMLTNGAFSKMKPKQITFVHFGDNGPKDTQSTYEDWRNHIIGRLRENELLHDQLNQDMVIGYEGLTIQLS